MPVARSFPLLEKATSRPLDPLRLVKARHEPTSHTSVKPFSPATRNLLSSENRNCDPCDGGSLRGLVKWVTPSQDFTSHRLTPSRCPAARYFPSAENVTLRTSLVMSVKVWRSSRVFGSQIFTLFSALAVASN